MEGGATAAAAAAAAALENSKDIPGKLGGCCQNKWGEYGTDGDPTEVSRKGEPLRPFGETVLKAGLDKGDLETDIFFDLSKLFRIEGAFSLSLIGVVDRLQGGLLSSTGCGFGSRFLGRIRCRSLTLYSKVEWGTP